MKVFFVQEGVTYLFSRLGSFIARHPFYFILFPVIITAVLSTGFFYIRINRDFDYLFAATDGKTEESTRLVNQLFPVNTSEHFEMSRATSTSQFMVIIIMAKDRGSILREDIFDEINQLDRTVRNFSILVNGNMVNYEEICGRRYGKCVGNDVINIAPHLKEIVSGRHNIKYPVHFNNLTMHYEEYVQSIGGVELDYDNHLRDIKGMRLIYALDITDNSKLQAINKWQLSISQMLEESFYQYIDVSFVGQEVIKEEVKDYTKTLVIRAPIAVITVMIFSFLTCMTNDWVRSKQWLGPSSCISAGLAIGSSFGLLFHIGIEYVDFCILLCYAVIATEIDDAFVLISSWRHTDPRDKVETRMAQAYSESAVSITITSLTSVLSFSLGITSTIPGVRISCVYGAFCCFFAYVYQLTFFGGCMALSGYREEQNLHPFTFRPIKESTNQKPSRGEQVSSQLRETLESLIMHKTFKCLVAVVFLGLLGIGAWGILIMRYGNELADGFDSDSPIRDSFELMHKYFGKYTYPVHIIFNGHINYADPSVQIELNKIIDTFKAYKHVAESDLELSWLKYYKEFQRRRIGKILLNGYNMTDERDFVYGLKYVFFKIPQARQFEEDVKFNEDFTKIVASRFILPMKDIYDQQAELRAIKDLYEIAENCSIPTDLFGLTFHLLEPSLMVPRRAVMLSVISTCLICVVFLLFVPNIPCALCVSLVVLCSIIETVGFVSLWNVRLDFISLIAFIYTVGLCINYPAHMSFAYLMGRNMSSRNRTKKALYSLAYPISQGCSSSVLGMVVIAFHAHYVSQCGFKFICIIAFVTAFHALFTVPVFLNVLGTCFKSLSVSEQHLPTKLHSEKEEKLQLPLTKECSSAD